MGKGKSLILFFLFIGLGFIAACSSGGGTTSSSTTGTTVGIGAAGNPALVNATVYVFGKTWNGVVDANNAIGTGTTDEAGYARVNVNTPSDGPPYYVVVKNGKVYNGTQWVDANGTYYGFYLNNLTNGTDIGVSSLTTMAFFDANATLNGDLTNSTALTTLNSTATRVARLFVNFLTDNGTLLDITQVLPVLPPNVDNATIEKVKRYRIANDLLAGIIENNMNATPETENFVEQIQNATLNHFSNISTWAQNATLISQVWNKVETCLQVEKNATGRDVSIELIQNATLDINGTTIALDNATVIQQHLTTLVPTTIVGVVADGYVANATLTIYNSPHFLSSNIIGSGTTDENGNFNIVLNSNYNSSANNGVLYIKSEGGILIDTGMPAPTMFFAGSSTEGKYNVTPVTDLVLKQMLRGKDLATSQALAANVTGISEDALYKNPVVNATAENGVEKVLSAKMLNVSLSPGNYTFYLAYYTLGDLEDHLQVSSSSDVTNRIVALPVSVEKNGTAIHITGETDIDIDFDGTNDQVQVEGWVIGGSVAMTIDVNDNASMIISGRVGLLGSVAGRARIKESNSEEPGVFSGIFMPDGITTAQRESIFNVLKNITQGESSLIYHQILMPDHEAPSVGYGSIELTGKEDNSGFDYDNFVLKEAEYNDTQNGMDITDILNGTQGSFDYMTDSDGVKIPMLLFPFNFTDNYDNSTINVYFLLPAGSGSGLYISARNNTMLDAGLVILTKKDSVAPLWEGGESYALASAAVGFHLLSFGQRDPVTGRIVNNPRAVSQIVAQMGQNSTSSPEVFTIPGSGAFNMNATYWDDEIYVFSGRSMNIVDDPDEDFNDAGNATESGDFSLYIEKYETGAMVGDYMMGGSIPWADNSIKKLYTLPASVVAFASINGTQAPDFTGQMDFVSQSIDGGGVENEVPVFSRGNLVIDSSQGNGTMTISYIDSDNYTPPNTSFAVRVDKISGTGLLHIYTPNTVSYTIDGQDRDVAWDIYWPIGAPKGVYFFSIDDGTGTMRVNEIGDIFVNF